jgi:hypothetical protein
MSKKGTAVQWLINQLIPNAMQMYDAKTCNAIEKALQLERWQIEHAWNDGCSEGIEDGQSTNCEEFYNNTYRGNNE